MGKGVRNVETLRPNKYRLPEDFTSLQEATTVIQEVLLVYFTASLDQERKRQCRCLLICPSSLLYGFSAKHSFLAEP